jgi:hypothetical protein
VSQLAQKIASLAPPASTVRRGPPNTCFPLYGVGDLDDWEAVETLRVGRTWREVQAHVDELAGVANPLTLEKFRYHWRRRCFCWPEDLRQ